MLTHLPGSGIKRGPVVVTGGAGFIGSHLVERLLNDGWSVVVVDDFSTGDESNLTAVKGRPGLKVIRAKVSACPDLGNIVADASFVFHLAAAVGVELVLRDPLAAIQTNLHETEAILDVAARSKTPLLLASTSEVYGKSHKAQLKETDDLIIGPPHFSRWSYACSKLTDEFLALGHAHASGLPITIVRLFNTVGPRQTGRHGMVLPRFVAAALKNEPLRVYGDGSQTRCFCHVLDTVEALLRLQSQPSTRGEIFNIGSEDEISIRDLASRVIQTLGSRSGVELIPYSAAYPPGFEEMQRRRPSVAKLVAATGFRPRRSLGEIIGDIAGGEVAKPPGHRP